jgi:radical SAM superfamily enzyme YgiQ (UPF0313 family)
LSNEDIARLLFSKLEGEKPGLADVQTETTTFLYKLRENELVSWQNSKDVLFVVPPFPDFYSKSSVNNPDYSSPPLGIAYLAAVLKQNNFDVSILDMHIQALNPEDIIAHYRKEEPRIVALSATTPTFPNAVKIAKLIKAWNEKTIIVLGGVHATCLPDECVTFECFDYIVVGEGEFTMLELANSIIHKSIEIEDINGLVYKVGNKTLATKPRRRLEDLDLLPYPARELLDVNAYYQKGSIISSRGCPYQCNYCSCAAISGHTYRVHSVDYVLNEVEFLMNHYDIKYFDFHDDTFNLYPERVFEICRKIKERQLRFHWGCFCRVVNFSYEIAQAMKDSGCNVIQFGVESGNQKVLDSIKKKISLGEIERAVAAAKRANIQSISCGFIIGHAQDTEESINQTIEFGINLSKIGANNLTISMLTPYPATEVYNNLGKNGIKLITKNWEQFLFSRVVIETQNISQEKLRELYVKGVEQFLIASLDSVIKGAELFQ